ncbi:phenylalanine--tRNA ligase subunit beta [archaeon]|nr:phenylalanine--tRNA ligase subunit beta [archaeon]
MPTVNLDKKTVLRYIGKNLTDKVLLEKIPMLGTDLEQITDDEIVVEIFPNRPDMLSEEGFSRAFSAFMGIKPGFRHYDTKKEGSTVAVKDLPKEWPYAVCAIVRGLKLDDDKLKSIIQLQEKLGVTLLRRRKKGGLGLYPLDKIKLPVTFTSYKKEDIRFRPLEGSAVFKADDILIKHPKGKEYGHIIEGWSRYPVFVDAEGTIMSMPPIINSHDVGKVTDATKNVFVECTGTDLNTLKAAMNIMLLTLADMGGKIYSLEMDYGKDKFSCPDFTPRKIKIDKAYAERLLGLKFTDSEVKDLLSRMGLGFENGCALVPSYRTDILHPIDLVEEIAIAYGYDNFESEISDAATVGSESSKTIFLRKVSDLFVGLGYLECKSFHMSNARTLFDKMNRKVSVDLVRTANAVNIEYDAMRNKILPGLMKILSENTHNEYPQNLFEAGTVFLKDKSLETNVSETVSLAFASAGLVSDFSQMKAAVESFALNLDIDIKFEEHDDSSFISGRCARLVLGGKIVGVVGEIHPSVLVNFGLDVPVSACEIELSKVMDAVQKH